jgi:PAS domain S-box-containing protein
MEEHEIAELERIKHRYQALLTRSRALLDTNPDIIFRIDREGRFLDFHAAADTKLAFPPEEFIGRKTDEFFGPEFSKASQDVIREALETGKMQIWEYPLVVDGETHDYEARIVPSGENEVVAIIRDVTESKRQQAELGLNEFRLSEAQRAAKIGSWERNLRTDEMWWSEGCYHLLELEPGEIAPSYRAFLERVHPDDRSYVEGLDRLAQAGKSFSLYFRLLLPSGKTITLYDRAFVVSGVRGQPERLVGIVQDITEQARLEREIVAAGERERDRISRDLHDGLGQTLTGISLSLRSLVRELEQERSAKVDVARQLEQQLEEALAESRRTAQVLSPGIAGLGGAVSLLVTSLDRLSDMDCSVDCSSKHERHDLEIETQLYRIAQEATSNALKHSQAKTLHLSYQCNGERIRLEILDDGIGISENDEKSAGFGLPNMHYRARLVNGFLEINRPAEGGTQVLCRCPCR